MIICILLYCFLYFLAVDLNANEIYEGSPNTQKADCTLTLPDETFVDLVCGKLDLKKVRNI